MEPGCAGGGILNFNLGAGEFAASLTVYEGTQMNSLLPIAPVAARRYRLQAGHEYFFQLASAYTPAGNFKLDTQFISLTNDLFAGRDYVQGTNWSYWARLDRDPRARRTANKLA